MHGATPRNDNIEGSPITNKESQKGKTHLPMFSDPSTYNHLSKDEKVSLTEKMKSSHKAFVQKMKNGPAGAEKGASIGVSDG